MKGRGWGARLLCLLALVAHGLARAEPGVDVTVTDPDTVSVASAFSVLEDATATLTLADIRSGQGAQAFRAAAPSAAGLNLGYSRSAFWLRLHLRNRADIPLERMLQVGNGLLDRVHLYVPDAQGAYREIVTGNSQPFSTRPYPNRGFVLPLSLPARGERVIYLRIQSASSLFVPGKLWTPQAFAAHERADYLRHAWYFGVATGLILFNLLLFIALKEVVYLLYVGMVTSTSLGLAAQLGLAKEFLWPNSVVWAGLATYVIYSLGLAAFMLFTRHMLFTATVLPRVDRLLRALVLPYLLMPFGVAAAPFLFMRVSVLLDVIGLLLILATGVVCVIRRQRSAYFFVAAFATLCLGATSVGLSALGVLSNNPLTTYALQIGSALEMLLLAFALADRYNVLRLEKTQAQSEALAAQADALHAQQRLVDTLQSSERVLEQRVEQRTAQLQATLNELRSAQAQLIQSEKLASLGQLVANVAHEINTPIATVKASGANIRTAMGTSLAVWPPLLMRLDPQSREHLLTWLTRPLPRRAVRSTREARALTRALTLRLKDLGVEGAEHKAPVLVDMQAESELDDLLPLLRHADGDAVVHALHAWATLVGSSDNIDIAVERVSKIVFALRSYSRRGDDTEARLLSLKASLETALTLHQGQMVHAVDLVHDVQEVPLIVGHIDALTQVWTNLIQNALQAMAFKGRLTVRLWRAGEEVRVSVGDTGCGMTPEVQARIFEPFFTTKPVGEGSGLGLGIVRKIVEEHGGRIEVQSAVGEGSTFTVVLPVSRPTAVT